VSEAAISNVHKRKQLLHERAQLSEQWDQQFPLHDFGTLQYDIDHVEGDPVRAHWRKVAQDAWNGPGWGQAAREYHKARGDRVLIVETPPEQLARLRKLMAKKLSLSQLWYELNNPRDRPTAETVVEAILHCVRVRGVRALDEAANIERLGRCDAAAITEIDARVVRIKGHKP
jgi:hypothetical protein